MADIGNYAVLGAGSVVVKSIPDFAIAVGNPAKVIKLREGAEAVTKKTP
jgi:acetyltransferase-like isoleucine patch superfamily enzyme